MKTQLTFLLITIWLHGFSQQIGDKLSTVLAKDKDIGISYYVLMDNYFEIVAKNDSIITVFIFDYSHEKLIGVDYIYREESLKKQALNKLISGSDMYGDCVWKKGSLFIMEKDNIIQIRDAKVRNRRIQNISKKEQRQANRVSE